VVSTGSTDGQGSGGAERRADPVMEVDPAFQDGDSDRQRRSGAPHQPVLSRGAGAIS
jgi:hypothetical protein